MGATFCNGSQLMVLCPIQGSTFCQPPDGGSWQLAMAPEGQQCCCQGTVVPFFKVIWQSQLLFKLPTPEPFSHCFFKGLSRSFFNVLFQGPFSRKCLFQGKLFYNGQGNYNYTSGFKKKHFQAKSCSMQIQTLPHIVMQHAVTGQHLQQQQQHIFSPMILCHALCWQAVAANYTPKS